MHTPVRLSPLRTLRRTWGLTQEEFARLISLPNASKLSLFEHGISQMKFDALAAYTILFDKSLAELDPECFAEVEERVLHAAEELWQEWKHDETALATRKREFLISVLKRTDTETHKLSV